MKYKCALLAVSDIRRSRSFYEDLLGQKVKFDFGEDVTFHGDFTIHLKSHFQKLIDYREIHQGGNNFELYFEDDDVEAIFHMLKGKGVTFVHELREQPWKQRVFRFYDPDKHIIEIGESMEYVAFRLHNDGLSADEISASTLMPLQFVEMTIGMYKKQHADG